jgi:hypothetical protein
MIEIGVTHIAGALIVLGGGIVGLIKGGYLRIGKNNGGPKHEVVVSEYCPRHESLEADRKERWQKLDETVAGWDKMAQTMLIENTERKGEIKQHEKRLENGDKKIDTLQSKVHKLDTGITVLLDRSGGVPKDWNER